MREHGIKSRGELADFIMGRDVDRAVEPPGLDRAGAVEQASHRPGDARADEQRERQAEYRSQPGQNRRDGDGPLLVPHRHGGVSANLRHHIRANAIDPLVKLVAKRIDPGQASPDFSKILRFRLQQRKQAVVLFVEVMKEIPAGILDPAVDPPQRRIIRVRGEVVDDGIDQPMDRAGLLFDRDAGRFIALLALGKACFVGRRLHLGDDHAAKLKRTPKRLSLHPRQVVVGFDVFCRQLIELMGDLSRHHGRQRRDDDHEDNQPDSNTENLASN
ncbi:hypothetical protein [Bradyrhizobium sp. S69]|uniref:hypothetical protein n=1 Tax=Bradyrhizobium sp. S69 TaxID=1641856 RepID=UPI001FEF5907|nr:hypothetical protein [Bradyrhizobium sp. S69]